MLHIYDIVVVAVVIAVVVIRYLFALMFTGIYISLRMRLVGGTGNGSLITRIISKS